MCDYKDEHLSVHKREINQLYPNVDIQIRCFDAGDEASVKSVVEDALEKYGRLDVMFANAGIVGSTKPFWDCAGDDFMKVMRTNALG